MNTKQAAEFLGCSTRTIRRYISSGKLPVKRHGNDVRIKKKDLVNVGSNILDNKETYKIDENKKPEPKEAVEPRDLIFELRDKPEELLNDIGKSEVMRVTAMLKTAELHDITDPMLIMKYALCQQMFFKYMSISDSEEELKIVSLGTTTSPYFKMMESYQRQAAFYEKELGLTTAARVKMKLPDAKPERDEMEDILES